MLQGRDRLHLALLASYVALVVGLGTNVVLGELRRELHFSDSITGLHGAFFGWALLVGGLGGAALARWRRGPVVVAALTLLSIGPLLVATGHAAWQTLLGAAIAGVGAALLVIVAPGLASDHHGADYVHRFSQINAAGAGAGIVFSLAVGLSLALGLGWRLLLATVPLLTAGCAVALLIGSPVPEDPAGKASHPLQQLRRQPHIRPHFWSIVIATAGELGTAIWAVPLLRDLGGASAGAAPALASLFAGGIMTSRLATSRRHTPGILAAAWIVMIVGGLLLWSGPGLIVRAAGVLMIGLGVGPHYPVVMGRLLASGGNGRDLSNVAAVASGVAITAGPLALGVLADQIGLRAATLAIPAIAAVGLVRDTARSSRRRAPTASVSSDA